LSAILKFQSPRGAISLNLDNIGELQIHYKRTHCELVAITPENQSTQNPFIIARRDNEWQIKELIKEINQLKKVKRDIIFEITDKDFHLTK
jgi:hypothetical protein